MFSPYILDSMLNLALQPENLPVLFPEYIRNNCSKFNQFQSLMDNFSGKGFDLQMRLAHQEFLGLLDDLIQEKLLLIETSSDAFETAVLSIMSEVSPIVKRNQHINKKLVVNPNNTSVIRFIQLLERYETFLEFGLIMDTLCTKLYADIDTSHSDSNSKTSSESNQVVDSGMCLTNMPASPCSRVVRVLWDIENMNPLMLRNSKRETNNASDFIVDLNTFLISVDCMGSGIDCQVSTFINFIRDRRSSGSTEKEGKSSYNANGYKPVTEQVLNEVDKANVEIIFASKKREDADRKLCNRWLHDMTSFRNMGVPNVTFVLLASDQDYRHMVQSAVNNGYTVLWVHEAPKNSKWRQTIEMYATATYCWDEDIVPNSTNCLYTENSKNNSRKAIAKDKNKNLKDAPLKSKPTFTTNEALYRDVIVRINKMKAEYCFGEVIDIPASDAELNKTHVLELKDVIYIHYKSLKFDEFTNNTDMKDAPDKNYYKSLFHTHIKMGVELKWFDVELNRQWQYIVQCMP